MLGTKVPRFANTGSRLDYIGYSQSGRQNELEATVSEVKWVFPNCSEGFYDANETVNRKPLVLLHPVILAKLLQLLRHPSPRICVALGHLAHIRASWYGLNVAYGSSTNPGIDPKERTG